MGAYRGGCASCGRMSSDLTDSLPHRCETCAPGVRKAERQAFIDSVAASVVEKARRFHVDESLKAGDVVQLKSGGPLMTIAAVAGSDGLILDAHGCRCTVPDGCVEATWMDGDLHRRLFVLEEIERAVVPTASARAPYASIAPKLYTCPEGCGRKLLDCEDVPGDHAPVERATPQTCLLNTRWFDPACGVAGANVVCTRVPDAEETTPMWAFGYPDKAGPTWLEAHELQRLWKPRAEELHGAVLQTMPESKQRREERRRCLEAIWAAFRSARSVAGGTHTPVNGARALGVAEGLERAAGIVKDLSTFDPPAPGTAG